MASRPAPALVLRDGDRAELERWTRSDRFGASAAKRARTVLLAADGVANTRIAELSGATVTTVLDWRGRYAQRVIAGLRDAPRPGRPRSLDRGRTVAETLTPPPKKLGVTHWSTRLLAERLTVSNSTIARAWRSYGIKPWNAESFRFSTDPQLVGKVTDICGLYLAPPEIAIVLCVGGVDEESQIQALDRTVPISPMQEGRIKRRSHDYYRHATSTLFAALDIATVQVTAAFKPRHRHQEFLAFLRQIERTYRHVRGEAGDPILLHLVMDNYAAHGTPRCAPGSRRTSVSSCTPLPRTPCGWTSSRSGSGSWSARPSPRSIQVRQGPQRQDTGLHRRLEPPIAPLCVDQDRRAGPPEGQPSNNLPSAPLASRARLGCCSFNAGRQACDLLRGLAVEPPPSGRRSRR